MLDLETSSGALHPLVRSERMTDTAVDFKAGLPVRAGHLARETLRVVSGLWTPRCLHAHQADSQLQTHSHGSGLPRCKIPLGTSLSDGYWVMFLVCWNDWGNGNSEYAFTLGSTRC
jgi:hypothetical protein